MRYVDPAGTLDRIALGAKHEFRIGQDAAEAELDARFESSLLAAGSIERQQTIAFGPGDRPAIRARTEQWTESILAHRVSSDEVGRQVKIFRRLGVSPVPVLSNGPVIVRLAT